ncbi:type VI secretion system baseplate subunit TssE [Frigidibacter oleivorans]|uniref:type VI secretion system baseplate subunit TssE n=1 Tax=Frigidibacter oleivorans TaxID=2487129 RepID=UPI0013DEB5EA|nr:type VI secretion system baseplate subunit TssE [Frigidibacter oleivorans]
MRQGQGHYQISLMNVFRRAAESRDATATGMSDAEGERLLSQRSVERREGASQATLRDHLAHDLANLLSTIHLAATLDLEGFDRVRRSVLNYGVQDMHRLGTSDIQNKRVLSDLRDMLIAHEPRLIPGSVEIRLRRASEDAQQRIAFDIKAEMAAHPVDVPLQFVAEVDTGAGKISMSDLKVQG